MLYSAILIERSAKRLSVVQVETEEDEEKGKKRIIKKKLSRDKTRWRGKLRGRGWE